jgi:hypothetical protein
MPEKPGVNLSGTVRKVLQFPSNPAKVQIAIESPDRVHKELRIENTLTDRSGQEIRLKTGAKAEVTIKVAPVGL